MRQENDSFSWLPWTVKVDQKTQNNPTCDFTHREPQTKLNTNHFQSKLEDLLNPYRVWTAL